MSSFQQRTLRAGDMFSSRIDFENAAKASFERYGLTGTLWRIMLVTTFVYVLLRVAYNLWFHPLRKVPGPRLARISPLWSRIGNYSGTKSERIDAAHKRYGPVVRVSPNELSFANPDAVHEIYTSANFGKEENFYSAKIMLSEIRMFIMMDPEAHRQRRKLLSRGFAQASLLEFEPQLTEKIETVLNQWSSRTKDGSAIDIYPWCHWLGFDTVYHLLFDHDPRQVATGQAHEVMKYIRAWRPLFTYREVFPSIGKWAIWLPGPLGNRFRLIKEWKAYAVGLIRDCRARGTKTPYLGHALRDTDAHLGRPLTDSELAEESMGGMFAGSGTTANTFVYICYAVARDQEVQKKLRKELQEAMPDPSIIPDYTMVSKLPYLTAVINETLRRYPTVVATLPRTAKRDVVVQGVHVPKGTSVGTQNCTIHRDPEAFPEPMRFIPERWLDEDPLATKRRNNAFVPFSVGPRRCIGINLAQMELWKLTSAFFRRFEVTLDPSVTEEGMRVFDTFSAGPAGSKLVIQLKHLS